MAAYVTRQGDVLDVVALKHYGRVSSSIVTAILEANYDLSEHGPILPGGLAIDLPDMTLPSSVQNGVSLWD
ncbi:phage tail protein [Dyella sp. M7H15-1]|uniref:tail protein X n=1 Tax=Dyella sp. M7H15-1 TaxID=2501295 RepID=UPI001005009A|nr:tail protein X [Dyella sp. M7H15-1]QAU22899.1 phage tail protein [Dyella sp. M7H15-1]